MAAKDVILSLGHQTMLAKIKKMRELNVRSMTPLPKYVSNPLEHESFSSFPGQDGFESNTQYSLTLEKLSHPMRHMHWVLRVMNWVPLKPVKLLYSSCYLLLVSSRPPVLQERMVNTISTWERDDGKDVPMYQAIRDADIPVGEKAMERLTTEMFAAAFAGPSLISIVLSRIKYHLIDDPPLGQKLREELLAVVSDPKELPTWAALNEPPYLTAVVHEGLRMMCDHSRTILPYETSQERPARIRARRGPRVHGGR